MGGVGQARFGIRGLLPIPTVMRVDLIPSGEFGISIRRRQRLIHHVALGLGGTIPSLLVGLLGHKAASVRAVREAGGCPYPSTA
jgi:hypothetical protein